jgi:hypothetical protein
VGSHILSGNVFEPRALDELFPDWRDDPDCPIATEVKEDKFIILGNETLSLPIPNIFLPPTLHNEGNYIISLSQLTVWLGAKASRKLCHSTHYPSHLSRRWIWRIWLRNLVFLLVLRELLDCDLPSL